MELPKFDLKKLISGIGLKEFDQVCKELGFFRLVNHGLDNELLDKVFDEMKHFFSLDH